MYEIHKEPGKNRVAVIFTKNFEHDQEEFSAELKAAAQGVIGPGSHFDLIVDFTAAGPMPQDHAQAGERAVAWCIASGLRKSANIMHTNLQRMQVKRVAARDDRFGYFNSRAEAESWLNE
ncbi:MAG: hypothetical protein ABJP48_05705 [Erythrobacter sp.]